MANKAQHHSTVLCIRDEGVAWVTLNRPAKRNAINPEMDRAMYELLDDLSDDDDIAVIVITGAGESFTAGADLRESATAKPAGWKPKSAESRHREWRSERLLKLDKITIAMVNGWCVGGGISIVLSCDLALAADEAQFSVPEVNFGGIPGGMLTKLLADTLSYRDALYYSLTAQSFDGRRAAEIGIVNASVPLASLHDATAELAKVILSKDQRAVRATKSAYRAVRQMDQTSALEFMLIKNSAVRYAAGADRHDALSAFLDDKSYKPVLGAADAAPAAARHGRRRAPNSST